MKRAASLLAAIALVAFALAPLYFAAVGALGPEARLFQAPPLLPHELTLDHFRALFGAHDFWTPLRNSVVVAGATTLVCVVVGAACAYALARLRFAGRSLVLGGILAVSMFPQVSIVPPLYLLLRRIGLIDSYPGLVLPYLTFALPLTIWMLTGFFRQLPRDLEEAALVDGASRLRALVEIVLPLAAPGLATAAIITFVYAWNEFLFALAFTTRPSRQTVPVAIALFRGQHQVPWGQVLAAALVATAPVALLVLVSQRRIVRGLTSGAVKG
jgi:ABC-type glycerol-3-phosphate transport system permease component